LASPPGFVPAGPGLCRARWHIKSAVVPDGAQQKGGIVSPILPPQAGGMESTPIPSITEYHETMSHKRQTK